MICPACKNWIPPDAAHRCEATPGEREQLEALIPCMRTSAQDTLAALNRAGYIIMRKER